MGNLPTNLENVYVAGPGQFYPGQPTTDGSTPRHSVLFNVISNNGKDRAGNPRPPQSVPVVAWGNDALIFAAFCMTGKQLNISGFLAPFSKELGLVNGKMTYDNRMSVNVAPGGITLLSNPSKYTDQNIAANAGAQAAGAMTWIQQLEDAGKLPPGCAKALADNNVIMTLYSPTYMNSATLLTGPKLEKIAFSPEAVIDGKFGNTIVRARAAGAGQSYNQGGAAASDDLAKRFMDSANAHGHTTGTAAETTPPPPKPGATAAAGGVAPGPPNPGGASPVDTPFDQNG